MVHYTLERKASVLKKLLPPQNLPIPEVSNLEGISEATLYNWRTKAKQQGKPVPGSGLKIANTSDPIPHQKSRRMLSSYRSAIPHDSGYSSLRKRRYRWQRYRLNE